MPTLPKHLKVPSKAHQWWSAFISSWNFYRLHLACFTLIPLIASGVMYGCNTEFHIPYIDCLFLCMSAMTVTGLATVNLSTLSAFQQALLFVQMVIGSITFVSIITIIVRRHFFRSKFKHVIAEQRDGTSSFSLAKTITKVATVAPPLSALKKRFSKTFTKSENVSNGMDHLKPEYRSATPSPANMEMKPVNRPGTPPTPFSSRAAPTPSVKPKSNKKKRNISVGMIKRVEGGGVGLVNPMGWYDGERMEMGGQMRQPSPMDELPPSRVGETDSGEMTPAERVERALDRADRFLEREERSDTLGRMTASPARMDSGEDPLPAKVPYAGKPITEEAFPRSKTIAFDDPDDGMDHEYQRGSTTAHPNGGFPRTATMRSNAEGRLPRSATNNSFPQTYSLRPSISRRPDAKLSGFGGFPTPFQIGKSLVDRYFPQATRTLTKTVTMPRTATIGRRGTISTDNVESGTGKEVPYISFAATVGRNSHFQGLTEEQMDELGGVEYSALRVLLYIVTGYFVFIQVAAFIIMAPYIAAKGRYDSVFEAQPRLVKIPWFALFQSISAFSNTGMSLVDLSMIPFQNAYLMIAILFILIFAGNTAFPILLRVTVWVIYKCAPKASKTRDSLKFLLDHPRRCFIYMFPSTQTWVLALVMLGLTLMDWVSFLVLDIGTPVIEAIPVGDRIASAFLQSAAVRAAGFGAVPVGALAPAVKVLYVIMMYISVYPIALSVRATNVYEERSLGLFNDEDKDYEPEDEKGAQAVAKYVGWHARRQLAFDIWWLGFALWLVCIIERGHLNNVDDTTWFNIFTIIFELVSAYGTVGLSLGVGYDNFSLSGSFRKLSKLVVIAVMLRGRHRGLPVAIDRAVMLPRDFTATEEQAFEETRSRRLSRRASSLMPEDFPPNFRRGSMSNNSVFRRDSSPSPSGLNLRRDNSPGVQHGHGQGHGRDHYRQGSGHSQGTGTGTGLGTGVGQVPSSPGSLQFSLPRGSLERERGGGGRSDAQRSPVALKGMGSGALSPVKESSMSRATTRAG